MHAAVEGDYLGVSKSQEVRGENSYRYSCQKVRVTHGGDPELAERVMKGVLGDDVEGTQEGEIVERVKHVVGESKPRPAEGHEGGPKIEEIEEEASGGPFSTPSHIEEVD